MWGISFKKCLTSELALFADNDKAQNKLVI